ncbi:MAG: hypothetical protein OXD43_01720 [Bacteroidetes bacterium]|nr:hypothetical protein [Bacteroidota bacterium]
MHKHLYLELDAHVRNCVLAAIDPSNHLVLTVAAILGLTVFGGCWRIGSQVVFLAIGQVQGMMVASDLRHEP